MSEHTASGAFFEAVTTGDTIDKAQKLRTENFWKAELEAGLSCLLLDGGVELLFAVRGKPCDKKKL